MNPYIGAPKNPLYFSLFEPPQWFHYSMGNKRLQGENAFENQRHIV